MLEARKEDAQSKMESFLKSKEAAIKIESKVEMGFPSDLLADYTKSKEVGIDLVVMGAKGEHNLAERILGSVTYAVIRDAACPVLAVPENCSDLNIKEIAYASDLKTDQAANFAEVAEIAAFFNAVLHCVSVDITRDETDGEKRKFNEIVLKLNLDISLTEIKSDTLLQGLEIYVQENGIDMLLMCRPQRSLFERIFHSSVTKKVALNSTVPLLVFIN
jgi:nucleotide-binding universal stress UspA family protein